MMARTPQYVVENTKPEEVPQMLLDKYKASIKSFNSFDWACQLKAMMSHDISKNFSNSMDAAAKSVKTELFIIVGSRDLMVNPFPALDFAGKADAETYVFENNCGHLAPGCEMQEFVDIVNDFFDD